MDKALSLKHSLVIEIQSDMVSGAIVRSSDNGAQEIIYHVSTRTPHKKLESPDHITRMMLKSLEGIAEKIAKEGLQITGAAGHKGGGIKDVHYVLSSPWVISRSKKAKIEYDENTEITSSIVQAIIEEEREKVFEEASEDIILIEEKIFDVQMNGYSVLSYEGKLTKDMEISFVFSLSSDEILKKIHSALSKHIHFEVEHYHSALLMQYLESRSLAMDIGQHAVIHVHGELTDVAIAGNGFSLSSFPFGASTLVRKISSSLFHSPQSAASILSMHEEGKLDEGHGRLIEQALFPELDNWHENCMRTPLPDMIYLSSVGHSGIFRSALEKSGRKVKFLDRPLIKIYAGMI